jgi:hypothetical protein
VRLRGGKRGQQRQRYQSENYRCDFVFHNSSIGRIVLFLLRFAILTV